VDDRRSSLAPHSSKLEVGAMTRSKELALPDDRRPTKPRTAPPVLDAIPQELRALPNWVVWLYEYRDGDWTKVPYDPRTGAKARSNDPSTWASFDEAVRHAGRYDGIGFQFGDSGLVGIDLDDCRDQKTGELTRFAQRIVSRFETYGEVSPSGTGVKLFVRGTWPDGGKQRRIDGNKIEVYPRGRYFTVTGQRLDSAPDYVRLFPSELAKLHEELFVVEAPPTMEPGHNGLVAIDRQSVMDRAAKYVAKMDQAVSGERGHDTTFHVACTLVLGFGLLPDEAWPIIAEWNQRCAPPWSEKDLRRKLDEANKEPRERGYLLATNNGSLRSGAAIGPANKPIPRDDDASLVMVDAWPEPMTDEAFHGLAGDFVRLIEPYTEADPAAILLQTLVAFGNAIGSNPHFLVESDVHRANLYLGLVGASSKARKGTSMGHVRRTLASADEEWARNRIQSGLSSGEGLIWAVRDPITRRKAIEDENVVDYQEIEIDPGVTDKRLLLVESELASVLKHISRQGNTLSAILRDAWDRYDLRSLVKNSPARATGCYVSVVAHITRDELRRLIIETELGNGFANRFLWACAKRSKLLPDGGAPPESKFSALAAEFRTMIERAQATGELRRDDAARDIWHQVYPKLSEGRPGLLGAVTSRAEAQVMRIALIYSLLDGDVAIRSEHLMAALAVWDYCEASARYIFGSRLGDPVADEILQLLRRNPQGLSRTELSGHFARNRSAVEISRALMMLADSGLARKKDQNTGGRPSEIWFPMSART
jgi:hypothetical protein